MCDASFYLSDPSRVQEVRQWRSSGCTWRRVAELAHEQWSDADWSPPSSQIVGMELCATAAKMLGEDPWDDPWN